MSDQGPKRCQELLVRLLHQHRIAVAVVNPRRIRAFAAGIGKDAKSDDEKKLQALVERRRQLLDLINQENNRRQQTADREIQDYIQSAAADCKR
jgi:transposase